MWAFNVIARPSMYRSPEGFFLFQTNETWSENDDVGQPMRGLKRVALAKGRRRAGSACESC